MHIQTLLLDEFYHILSSHGKLTQKDEVDAVVRESLQACKAFGVNLTVYDLHTICMKFQYQELLQQSDPAPVISMFLDRATRIDDRSEKDVLEELRAVPVDFLILLLDRHYEKFAQKFQPEEWCQALFNEYDPPDEIEYLNPIAQRYFQSTEKGREIFKECVRELERPLSLIFDEYIQTPTRINSLRARTIQRFVNEINLFSVVSLTTPLEFEKFKDALVHELKRRENHVHRRIFNCETAAELQHQYEIGNLEKAFNGKQYTYQDGVGLSEELRCSPLAYGTPTGLLISFCSGVFRTECAEWILATFGDDIDLSRIEEWESYFEYCTDVEIEAGMHTIQQFKFVEYPNRIQAILRCAARVQIREVFEIISKEDLERLSSDAMILQMIRNKLPLTKDIVQQVLKKTSTSSPRV